MAENVLELKDLEVCFDTPQGTVEAVRGVNLTVKEGEILCLVGESGCGKTVLCHSVMHLLPRNGYIRSGSVYVDGTDITYCTEKMMRQIRGKTMSMVFQDPLTTLNPTVPIGKQITETIHKHQRCSRQEAKEQAIKMLQMVGIPDPEKRFYLQPHFFSGGMRQRCVLASALASQPKLLFADEATTALDVTMETRILDLLKKLRDETGIGIVFVTHDLGAVARIADRVAVMYAGKIVELGTAEDVFYDPRHPYTWGLLGSLPQLAEKTGVLQSIPGMPPALLDPPPGDAFAERNPYALRIDYEEMPPMTQLSETHVAASWLLDPKAPSLEPPIRDLIRNGGFHE